MCGIAGILDPRRRGDEGALTRLAARLTGTLAHRGPDGSGLWTDVPAGLALGHRRLSIIDLSPAGAQPMTSRDGRMTIVFNGCVYNFADLRRELEAAGRRFRGHSDTEVVVEAMAAWGIEAAVKRFVGMFAIAVWDRGQGRLSLIRDRYGVKPLYYGLVGGALVFGSELRVIEAFPGFDGTIDRGALALYVNRSCVPAPWTIYRAARKLPPATILTLDPAHLDVAEPVPYWSLRDLIARGRAERFAGGVNEATDALESLLTDAVRCRLIADVPVGVLLSGGIDSTLIAALAQRERTTPIQSFTIGFADQAYDEAHAAKAVAAHLGTDHHELYLSPEDARAVIPELPRIYDEPFADSSQIPTFLVARLARQSVTVALSGDGGDELFGGYNRYLWNGWIGARTRAWPGWFKRSAAKTLLAVKPSAWDAAFSVAPAALRQRNPGDKLHKLARVLEATDAGAMYRGIINHWPAGIEVVPEAPHVDIAADPSRWLADADPIDQMMYLDALTYLPDDILVKVDRATMAVGLEARAPYLDHRVAEFAWRLPQSFKIENRRGKLPLRRLLARLVPESLTERPKMGFAIPLHEWLRGPLRGWAEELLTPDRLAGDGFFASGPIRAAWREHLAGRRNRQHELWPILMFQAWREARKTRAETIESAA